MISAVFKSFVVNSGLIFGEDTRAMAFYEAAMTLKVKTRQATTAQWMTATFSLISHQF
jgi:predicted enzyme related to lactoylglutathione lyase